jgi:hypothetical protein
MKSKGTLIILFIIIWMVMIKCTPRDRYERLVAKELGTGEKFDSLFLGLKLGMTDHQFYGQCWEMNKLGLIRQGAGNTTVLYSFEELKAPAEMNFYPDFYQGRIWRMPVKYSYKAWAPWNPRLSADSLQIDLLNKYKEWYDDDFMEVRHPFRGSAYIRVDGNRRIAISKADEMSVWVIFTDLLVEKEIKDQETAEDNGEKEEENPLLDAIGNSED